MIITMTHTNRPEYSEKALRSIKDARGSQQFELICFVEPINHEVYRLVKNFPIQKTVILNKHKLGVNNNTAQALYYGFVDKGHDRVLHIEDDVTICSDAFDFLHQTNHLLGGNIGNICLYNKLPPGEINTYSRHKWFTAWGFVLSRHVFKKMITFSSCCDHPSHYLSWDTRITHLYNQFNLYEIAPNVSRANNIGALGGVHVPSAEWHKTHHFIEKTIDDYGIDTTGIKYEMI